MGVTGTEAVIAGIERIMVEARFRHLVTLDAAWGPRSRLVDPFGPLTSIPTLIVPPSWRRWREGDGRTVPHRDPCRTRAWDAAVRARVPGHAASAALR
jgi:hypothetical protein